MLKKSKRFGLKYINSEEFKDEYTTEARDISFGADQARKTSWNFVFIYDNSSKTKVEESDITQNGRVAREVNEAD